MSEQSTCRWCGVGQVFLPTGRDRKRFPEVYAELDAPSGTSNGAGPLLTGGIGPAPSAGLACTGPVTYVGRSQLAIRVLVDDHPVVRAAADAGAGRRSAPPSGSWPPVGRSGWWC